MFGYVEIAITPGTLALGVLSGLVELLDNEYILTSEGERVLSNHCEEIVKLRLLDES